MNAGTVVVNMTDFSKELEKPMVKNLCILSRFYSSPSPGQRLKPYKLASRPATDKKPNV